MILFIWGPVDCEGGPVDLGVGGMGDMDGGHWIPWERLLDLVDGCVSLEPE